MMLPRFRQLCERQSSIGMLRAILNTRRQRRRLINCSPIQQTAYTRELLFSSSSMYGEVVCRIRPSVHAAIKPSRPIRVSLRAVYDNSNTPNGDLGGVGRTYRRQARSHPPAPGGRLPALLSGYRVRILDGTISGTEHAEELRTLLPVPCPVKRWPSWMRKHVGDGRPLL